MASEPGLSEYVTAMQRNRQGVLRDNISNNNPLQASMEEYDAIELESGGRTIIEEMASAENASFVRYYGAQVLNTSYNPTITAAEFDWKQFAIAVLVNGREERMNGGKEGIIKLVSSRVKVAEYTLENKYQADMLSDGTADSGLQIGGLKLIVAKTPTNTVGGIDRSTTAGVFYKNVKFDTVNDSTAPAPGGVATSATTIRPYLDYCINSTTRGVDRVKMLYQGQTHYQYLETALQAMQRVTSESKSVKAGYETLIYKGIPVFMGGGVNFGGETQIQTDLTYGLNTRFLKMRVHKDANFEPLPEVHSINQDAKVKLMIWMGNMTCSAPGLQFVMYDS